MPQTRTPPRASGDAARRSVDWQTLRELASFRAGRGCAISFYLDLDPRLSPTAAEVQTRTRALLDEAAKRAEAMRERQTHEQQASTHAGLERIERYFDGEFTRDGVRGVAVFVAVEDGLWRPLLLSAPVRDCVSLGAEVHVTPLVPLVGRGNGTLVAVVGRERGDVYELRQGRLEAVASRFEEQPRRHDQGGWSQANFQRHVDNLTDRHLRGVVDDLERSLRRHHGADLVVVCAEEARSEVRALLSAEARSALAGWAQAEAHANVGGLLSAIEPVLERRRVEREAEALDRWHDAMGQSGRASAGWEASLEAASDGRVDCLLYEQGANRAIRRCRSCGRLALEEARCPVDGAQLEQCEEGLDLLLHATVERGGSAVEIVARRDLEPVGGVGALLRF